MLAKAEILVGPGVDQREADKNVRTPIATVAEARDLCDEHTSCSLTKDAFSLRIADPDEARMGLARFNDHH